MAQSDDAATPGATTTTIRVAVLIWSIVLFGTLSVLTFRDRLESLFGG